jgi:hypothetical protein
VQLAGENVGQAGGVHVSDGDEAGKILSSSFTFLLPKQVEGVQCIFVHMNDRFACCCSHLFRIQKLIEHAHTST